MAPGAHALEMAPHNASANEAFQQIIGHNFPAETALPHIHNEYFGHEHHIGLKEAHACEPDCPEHGDGHHDHAAEMNHADARQEHGHEHNHHEPHTITRKAPEHACSADCPEHANHHHREVHSHEHREYKESPHDTHQIEHKAHACSADCPEHGHGNHSYEHEDKEPKLELKEHHACGPDCPEHSHTTREHHNHHEHDSAKPHTITQKAPEHACSADCPEHGRAQHHTHAHKHEPQPTNEKAHTGPPQEQAEALLAQRIRQELDTTQPQPEPRPTEQARPAIAAGHIAHHEAQAREDIASVSVAAEPKPAVLTAPEALPEIKTFDSTPVLPIEVMEQPAATGLELEQVPTAPLEDHERLDVVTEAALPVPLPTIESQPAAQQETVFDIPALLAKQTDTPIQGEVALPLSSEVEPLAPIPLPELPAAMEPLPVVAATVAQTITERYQDMVDTAEDTGSKTMFLQPAQRVELHAIIAAIQSRNTNTPVGPQETQPLVTPREFVRLLQLLGFENPAQTLESYIKQYGYGLYDDLLAQLFELLHYAKPVEVPTLPLPVLADDQADWVHTLGKVAVLLGMFARQLTPSPPALHRYIQQPKGAVS